MGVCINYTLMQTRENVKKTIEHGEKVARAFKKQADTLGIPFEIHRDKVGLLVNIGGCESLVFDFKSFNEQWPADANDWLTDEFRAKWWPFEQSPEKSDHYKQWPNQISMWASGFCKTQFSESTLEHVWVAEILRAMASMCLVARVYDEGDYYHTREMSDAQKAIAENGALIDGMVGTLENMGYKTGK